MKKTLAVMFLGAFLTSNFTINATYALSAKVDKSNALQAQITQTKYQRVNFDWWKNYNDEHLEGYILKALNDNHDLQIAALKVEEARQMMKVQFANELPSATIGAMPSLNKMPGLSNSEGMFVLPIIANYEVDIFLKNRDKTKSAKKAYEAQQLNEKATYIVVASQIGATYFNIVKLDKLIAIQEEIIKDREQIFTLTQQRNKAGVSSSADEVRAHKAYMMAVADMSDLKKAQGVLLGALAVMTAQSPAEATSLKRLSYDELVFKGTIPDFIPSDIITQRPDYLAAEKMLEKAGLDTRAAKKELLPSISIMGILAFNSNSIGTSFGWQSAIASLGASAFQTLFTGGAKVANLKINKGRYEQMLQSYLKINLTAIQEVNDALSALKLDSEKYEKNLASYAMQKQDYGYTEQKYKQGVISRLDLLQQREMLLSIDKLVAAGKIDCLVDEISLYKAVGGKMQL